MNEIEAISVLETRIKYPNSDTYGGMCEAEYQQEAVVLAIEALREKQERENRRAQPSEKPKPLTLMLGGGKYWIADYVCPDSGDVGICAYPRESDDGVIGAADSSCVGKSIDDVGAVLKIEFSKLESIDVVIRALEKAKANYRSKPKEEV